MPSMDLAPVIGWYGLPIAVAGLSAIRTDRLGCAGNRTQTMNGTSAAPDQFSAQIH
jgi:hypothetical protein